MDIVLTKNKCDNNDGAFTFCNVYITVFSIWDKSFLHRLDNILLFSLYEGIKTSLL